MDNLAVENPSASFQLNHHIMKSKKYQGLADIENCAACGKLPSTRSCVCTALYHKTCNGMVNEYEIACMSMRFLWRKGGKKFIGKSDSVFCRRKQDCEGCMSKRNRNSIQGEAEKNAGGSNDL